MWIRNHVDEMFAWGCLAVVVGLGINLIHPHRIPYMKSPPPPKVIDNGDVVPQIQEIDVSTAKDLWDLGEYLFVDSRSPVQHAHGNIAKSVNLSWEEFEKYYPALKDTLHSKPGLVIYCAGEDCDLSHALARRLYKEGFRDMFVFFGGWEAWQEAGYPAEGGP
jgi:rhodanese-related sulfurtransferase